MTTETEAFLSTIGAAVAAIAAVLALLLAWLMLREARATSKEQRAILIATEALAGRVEASTSVLRQLLEEAQAARGLEQLQRVATQLPNVVAARQMIRLQVAAQNPRVDWDSLTPARELFRAQLETVTHELPKCRAIAEAVDPRESDNLDGEAAHEIKQALSAVRLEIAARGPADNRL